MTRARRRWARAIVLVSLPLAASGVPLDSSAGTRPTRLSAIPLAGPAEVQRPGPNDGSWRSLKAATGLEPGDVLRTGPAARLEVWMPDGSALRLGPRSRLSILRASFGPGERQVTFRLHAGRVWARVAEAQGRSSSFRVETEHAVASVRGTSFAVLARKDTSALVRVYAGTVGVQGTNAGAGYATRPRRQVPPPTEISRSAWREVIAAARTEVAISSVGEIRPAEVFEDQGESLEWARWNQDRDRRRR